MKIKPADMWFSKCIRQRDNWTCQKCGKEYEWDNGRGLDCSHNFGRSRRSTRWAKENAISLCMGCHRWFHSFPVESAAWLEKRMGTVNYELLVEKANTIMKVTKAEEKEIATHYRKEYKRMVAEDDHDFESWQ